MRFLKFFSLAISIFYISTGLFKVGSGEIAAGWKGPINVSNSEGQSGFPSIVADKSGVVHLFWNEEILPNQHVIMYSHLENDLWSPPIDIFPFAEPAHVVSSIDSKGYIHIIWTGIGGINYSRVYAPNADNAHNWKAPRVQVPSTNFLGDYHFVVSDEEGKIVICLIYAIQIGANSGIYTACSFDQGETWQPPSATYQNLNPGLFVDKPQLAITSEGRIHAIWAESNYPEIFPPIGIRYAYSDDWGISWSFPQSLADGPYTDPAITITSKNEIHVVWSGTADDRYKFHLWSSDNGVSWHPLWRNLEVGGLAGTGAIVEDSIGRLHWLTVGDIFSLPIEGPKDALYYSYFTDYSWSPGIQVFREDVPEQNMSFVSATMALGNRLNVVAVTPVRT
ncbi:MAG: sialidase family protein, partial [Candidatus Methanosuratincola sp.]|nr:sialidase family protein [Candidatus Methanosuratincola sp.]